MKSRIVSFHAFTIAAALIVALTVGMDLTASDSQFSAALPIATNPATTTQTPQVAPPAPPVATSSFDLLGTLDKYRSELALGIVTALGFVWLKFSDTAKANTIKAVGLAHSLYHTLIDDGIIHPDAKITDIETEFWSQFSGKYFNATGTAPTPLVKTVAHTAFMRIITDQGRGEAVAPVKSGV